MTQQMTDLEIKAQQELARQSAEAQAQMQAQQVPADVAFYLTIFPIVLQGYAGKAANSNDAVSSAIDACRIAVGQHIQMGLIPVPNGGTRLATGELLARMPQSFGNAPQAQVMPVGMQPTGHSAGHFVGQYPTLPQAPVKTM